VTATIPARRPAAPAPGPAQIHSGTRRTLLALLASALGALPLKTLISDDAWLVQSWLAMVVVLAPAALLRLRRAPSALDIWPGIVLLVPWLTRLYVPHHAWGGFIPTKHTFSDVGTLMDSLHRTTTNEVAPIHSTIAVRLVICARLGLLAALIDLIAVVGRRGALAGVPLLVVYTVAGAVPRTPVAWVWFAAAAAGYLVLLGLDADDELHDWGRRISRPGTQRSGSGLGVSAQRIGVIAVVIAVILPLLVPDHPKNLIADAFHNSNSDGLGGFGAGSGGTGGISPFAALKGQLNRDKATPLMNVHVDPGARTQLFYARSNILDRFTGKGWTVTGHGDTEGIDTTSYGTQPATDLAPTSTFRVDVKVTGLTGNAPVFAVPRSVQGLEPAVKWSDQDQLLLGGSVREGDVFTEEIAQPQPTVDALNAAPPATGSAFARWLALPQLPTAVTDLVAQITKGKQTPYAKARALSDWFADPANGFVYSLKTTKGDSGNDLVDFLDQRTGFCQQYAAAMGVMLRAAGVPARVVLGYMHAPANGSGDFSISTLDAHAWVEAFFPGAGWVPFDTTPTTGLVGGKKSDLSWAPHVYLSGGVDVPSRTGAVPRQTRTSASAGPSQAPQAGGSGANGPAPGLVWGGAIVLLVLLVGFAPAAVRAGRRRRRFAAARRGDPDPLWAELSDTAVDLGYVWSPARSPRQVSVWLAPDAAGSAPALNALAVAVEQRRYAPGSRPADPAALTRGLQEVTDQLRSRRTGPSRLRALLWPASLGWGRRLGAVRSHLARKRH
jgi:transglutaminase-like putative cysteine protease